MKSILLIDKSHKSAEVVADTLEGFDFHVEVAGGGVIARGLLEETRFDLILMEFLSRPDIGQKAPPPAEVLGEEFGKSTALIRELRARRVVCPIIVYTTLRGPLYETASLDAGADDYILKSDDSSILLSRLHAHLRRRQRELGIASGEDRRIPVGTFVIDRQTRILLSGRSPVQLTPKEVSLLEKLAANPHRIVRVSEVLEHIWGDGSRESNNLLQALVQRLRKKMEKHRLPDPIQTVRGMGLKLSPLVTPQGGSFQTEPPRQRKRVLRGTECDSSFSAS